MTRTLSSTIVDRPFLTGRVPTLCSFFVWPTSTHCQPFLDDQMEPSFELATHAGGPLDGGLDAWLSTTSLPAIDVRFDISGIQIKFAAHRRDYTWRLFCSQRPPARNHVSMMRKRRFP
ncbi:conserved hypothetical protein [Ricinus communis]|uniref:Uncharacterized protein n=1 Tax=Ricinus communis TaxID=3988 RepID=B9THP0_RICCO|nr:conserved hypothetical protein [Ricinus communis]